MQQYLHFLRKILNFGKIYTKYAIDFKEKIIVINLKNDIIIDGFGN